MDTKELDAWLEKVEMTSEKVNKKINKLNKLSIRIKI
jgi:hypothetical protein